MLIRRPLILEQRERVERLFIIELWNKSLFKNVAMHTTATTLQSSHTKPQSSTNSDEKVILRALRLSQATKLKAENPRENLIGTEKFRI